MVDIFIFSLTNVVFFIDVLYMFSCFYFFFIINSRFGLLAPTALRLNAF